jgi:opacity protein-like surface antigen
VNKKLSCGLVLFSTLITIPCFSASDSKLYLRLDLGYGLSSGTKESGPALSQSYTCTHIIDDPEHTCHLKIKEEIPYQYNNGLNNSQHGTVGSFAMGYKFNNEIRGEISLDFKGKMTAKAYNFKVETTEHGGSAKLLYDFNNNGSVTPFIFGGFGATTIKPKIKPYSAVNFSNNLSNVPGTPYLTNNKSGYAYIALINNDNSLVKNATGRTKTFSSIQIPSKTVITYQAGFGLALKATEDISLDLTYGIRGRGDYKVLNNVAALFIPKGDNSNSSDVPRDKLKEIKFKNQIDQSLTLGIRFSI